MSGGASCPRDSAAALPLRARTRPAWLAAAALLLGASACACASLCACATPARGASLAELERKLPPPDAQAMLALVRELAPGDDARRAGSAGEQAAAELLAGRFRALGLETRIEEFPAPAFSDRGSALELPGGERVAANSLIFAPATPPGGVSARLVDGGLGYPEELGAARGNIALCKRGSIYFRDKVANAARAGALGIIVHDPALEELQALASLADSSGLPPIAPIPAVTIAGSVGSRLAALLAEGGRLEVRLTCGGQTRETVSRNVYARFPGAPAEGTTGAAAVILGAHLDSVGTPGALDDASGLACLFEAARMIVGAAGKAGVRPAADLWFIAFGAEEIGSLGSRRAAGSWGGAPLRGMLALDTVGLGGTTMVYTLRGDGNAVAEAAIASARALDLVSELGASEASDHAPFAYGGVPAAFLMREPVNLYHTDADAPEAVDPAVMAEIARIAAGAVLRLATRP